MEGLDGLGLLRHIAGEFPDARKVLLTAWSTTSEAVAGIGDFGLDYYLAKPWEPADAHLYPVVDGLLSDWNCVTPAEWEGIRVVGTQWSPRSHEVKDFLSRNRVPYQWLDVDKDPQARALARGAQHDGKTLPIILFPDGVVLSDCDMRTLASQCGLQTEASQPFYDLVILGAGPAGLGAAVYAASEGLRTAVIEKQATGGQAGTSSRIENYLGFPNGLSGAELAQRATLQASRFGAEILTAQEAVAVRVDGPYRLVALADGTELACHALLVATGVTVRKLDLPHVQRLSGAGIYYGAALTEAAHHKGEHVLVVGGANSAGQGAMFFARYAGKVTILVRGSSLEEGMSQYLVDQIRATPNIEVLTQAEVAAVHGVQRLEAVTVCRNGVEEQFATRALFLFIGAEPHSEAVAGLVARDEDGFILTGADLMHHGRRPRGWRLRRDPLPLETSVPGIFAAGDVRQGAVRRVASAVGEGAVAVSLVHQYLRTV
jgi:thioredoxin reductase (NADPH)